MNPVKTEYTTRVLGAPSNWDEKQNGECIGLPIIDSHSQMFSVWKPTLKERFQMLFGAPICLSIFSSSHPPVWIATLTEINSPDGKKVGYKKFMKASQEVKS